MRQWLASLNRIEQVTLIGIGVTLVVGLVTAVPAYFGKEGENKPASATTPPDTTRASTTSADTTVTSDTEVLSIGEYRQEVGQVCDRLEALSDRRAAAYDRADATGLLAYWKLYKTRRGGFATIPPPKEQEALHDETANLWRRHEDYLSE
jgi:hypothetical protein